jgi:hypothetical protein
MDCFEMKVAQLADQSTFNQATGMVTTQFANADDFLNQMENELSSDNNDVLSTDRSVDGTPHGGTTFYISKTAKASLASTLNGPDMDLAANLHASAKSCQTNFSSSTGNSTNPSVNTKQYALTHKARALALALEVKHATDLEHTNKSLALQIRELQAQLANVQPSSDTHPSSASLAKQSTQRVNHTIFQDEIDLVNSELDNNVQSSVGDIVMEGPDASTPFLPSKQDDASSVEQMAAHSALNGDDLWSAPTPPMPVGLGGEVKLPLKRIKIAGIKYCKTISMVGPLRLPTITT